jgi:hypothetical protein
MTQHVTADLRRSKPGDLVGENRTPAAAAAAASADNAHGMVGLLVTQPVNISISDDFRDPQPVEASKVKATHL